jgi:hypothetical protein
MKYVKVTEFIEHETNPFVKEAVNELITTKKRQVIRPPKDSDGERKFYVLDHEGNMAAESMFVREIEVDNEQFNKLFIGEFFRFFSITTPGIRVFGYLMKRLGRGDDKLYFHMGECMEYTEYKHRNQVNTGLAQLLTAGIIARSVSLNVYYINPKVLFNGNRVTFAKSYVRKQIKEKDPQQLALSFNPNLSQLRELSSKIDSTKGH